MFFRKELLASLVSAALLAGPTFEIDAGESGDGTHEFDANVATAQLIDILAAPPPSLLKPEDVFHSDAEPGIIRQTSRMQDLPQRRLPGTLSAPPMQSPLQAGPVLSRLRLASLRPSLLTTIRLARRRQRKASDIVRGGAAAVRITTDAASLLGKAAKPKAVQKRTPIVTDPRTRGARVGSLAASGSHWVPARIDLDTVMSKMDSRLVESITVTPGPYSVRNGPALQFYEVDLTSSPRFADGGEVHATSIAEYQSNGEQWHGRQNVWGGNADAGFFMSYGHRTGSDYESGDGIEVPASYKSRDLYTSLGYDLGDNSQLEFSYLRLDQTEVEFPGQAFDFDYLVTDGFDLKWVVTDQPEFEQFEVDAWYNQTRFAGDSRRSSKGRQFPFLGAILFLGETDVDSVSTGASAAITWGDESSSQLTVGTDFRFIRQQLEERVTAFIPPVPLFGARSPLADSYQADTGLFAEFRTARDAPVRLTSGVRADVIATDVLDDTSRISSVSSRFIPLENVLGDGEFDREFGVWSAYVTAEAELDEDWLLIASAGHGQRPPSLTELYIAESFLFLLQNGVNTATGDPRLSPEKSTQLDLALTYETGQVRASIRGFHAWVHDFITFELLSSFAGEQSSLKYVNTPLATRAGFDGYFEADVADWLTPFASARFVEGRDHSRNGNYGTRQATALAPSTRDPSIVRGQASGFFTGDKEPLPQIPPLEARFGLRLHQPGDVADWWVELSVRVVDDQGRVATSLLEEPTPGFTTYDIRGVWRPTDRLQVIAGIENFTDKSYQEHLDFRSATARTFQPGRSIYIGSELQW